MTSLLKEISTNTLVISMRYHFAILSSEVIENVFVIPHNSKLKYLVKIGKVYSIDSLNLSLEKNFMR
jgi:polysaccharide pyruvyl transferase WcaK-like protein